MKILLINPPNCGRSIPEERYGITSLKQIFRGEPLALEVLAGNLDGHDVRIVDLKAQPDTLEPTLKGFRPDVAAITGMTCEANTVVKLARQIREHGRTTIVVGGIHASNDPGFFTRPEIDYIVVGLGKASFRQLIDALEREEERVNVPGVVNVASKDDIPFVPRRHCQRDLEEEKPPRYDLVATYRDNYTLASLGLQVGFVVSAFGCPFDCSFCCIANLTDSRYLTHNIDTVLRDIRLLGDIPVIRLVDANTFGDIAHSRQLCRAIRESGLRKNFIADVRSDTVVRHPELLQEWKEAGLRSVVIGFEEISDDRLEKMNKANQAAVNTKAIRILNAMGITIVGDFIVSPDYTLDQFETLGRYIEDNPIDLPIVTVLTPLPGTAMHRRLQDRITIRDLDYYTLTNAVLPTTLPEESFYRNYADLMAASHAKAKL